LKKDTGMKTLRAAAFMDVKTVLVFIVIGLGLLSLIREGRRILIQQNWKKYQTSPQNAVRRNP
jgi:hypothetical protein